MKPIPRQSAAALGVAALVAIAGCQSYQPQPLDLDAHRRAWLDRTPEAPEVAAFAARLAAADRTAPAVFDVSDGVSLPEAEAVALVFNADLRIARLRANVTLAAAQNAGLWQDPVLGADITRIIESTANPWKVMTTVAFTLPISGRLGIEKQRAGAEHAVSLLKVYEAEWRTRMDLRREWATWTAAGLRVETTRAFVEGQQRIVDIVDRVEKAGAMSRVEARLFRIQLATRRADLRKLESDRAEAELTIKRLMGLAPSANVELAPGQSAGGRLNSLEDLQGWMPNRNPELALARAEYEVAERTLELEVRKQYPDLTVGPGYGLEDGQDQFLLDLAVPLPILNANRQGIATAAAEREVSRARFETEFERLSAELETAEVRMNAAATERRALEDEIVPLVDQEYAETRRVAELGEVNTLILLETLNRQQEAKIRLIDARLAEGLATIRLDELVGPLEPLLTPPASAKEAPAP